MPSGPAEEHGVDVGERRPVVEQRARPRAVDAAVQQLDVLRLARQHVHEVEALQVHVLQRRELLAEHHARRRAVAVEQRELRVRLARERRLDDRQDRRDPAACRERDVVALRRPSSGTLKWPIGGITSSVSPRFQLLVRPGREHAAGRALDRDPQPVVAAPAEQIEYERRTSSPSIAARSVRCWPCA